jgi:hypothetical protein
VKQLKLSRMAVGAVATLVLGLAVTTGRAHPGLMEGVMGPMMGTATMQGSMHGRMMGGPMAAAMQHDEASSADMRLVHELLVNHDRIRRTVTRLPNGIRTVTESDDPHVVRAIQAHVASMAGRLSDGREFNMFSRTVPVLFENRNKIETRVETTEKGSVVTQTSSEASVVAALQGHADEVSELARDGMVAMMRTAMASVGMSRRAGMGRHASPVVPAPAEAEHAH